MVVTLGWVVALGSWFSPVIAKGPSAEAPASGRSPQPAPASTTRDSPNQGSPRSRGLSVDPAPVSPRTSQPAAPLLVWSADGTRTSTHWLTGAPTDGSPTTDRPGRWVSVAGRDYVLEVETVTLDLPTCTHLLEGTGPALGNTGHAQRLVARTESGEDHVLSTPRTDAVGVESTIEEISVVGPYLLIETQDWVDVCGVMPDESRSLTAWDLERWERVDLEHADRSAHEDLLADARLALEGDCPAPLHLGIGTFRPQLFGSRLLGRYAVTVTPACDDLAEWTENVSHLWLTSPALPPTLAPFAEVPPAVRDFFAVHPDQQPLGWTAVESQSPR